MSWCSQYWCSDHQLYSVLMVVVGVLSESLRNLLCIDWESIGSGVIQWPILKMRTYWFTKTHFSGKLHLRNSRSHFAIFSKWQNEGLNSYSFYYLKSHDLILYIQTECVRNFYHSDSIHAYVIAYFIIFDHWLEDVKRPVLMYWIHP